MTAFSRALAFLAVAFIPQFLFAADQTVTLPYTQPDKDGNQWMVHYYGYLQQQGNMPVYSQGAMLQINGQYPQARNNQARVDDKTGELIFDAMQALQFLFLHAQLLNGIRRCSWLTWKISKMAC